MRCSSSRRCLSTSAVLIGTVWYVPVGRAWLRQRGRCQEVSDEDPRAMTTQMAAEIAEQPEAARRTLDALLPAARPEIRATVRGGRRRVLFVGARVQRQRRDLRPLPARDRTPASPAGWPRPASPPTTARGSTSPTPLVVAVSQSGATTEIVADPGVGARRAAPRPWRSRTWPARRSPRAADLALVTQAGPELAVPATKTYLDPAGRDGRPRHGARAGPGRARHALDRRAGRGRAHCSRRHRRRRRRGGAPRRGVRTWSSPAAA